MSASPVWCRPPTPELVIDLYEVSMALVYLNQGRTGQATVSLTVRDLPPEDLAALRGLRFTGDVWAIPEGRVVLAGEPLVEVTAALPQAQLVETFLLNQLSHQTTLSSKAARCVLAARGVPVVDFSLRRTHGVEAGMYAARAGAVVGFAGTSNVAAALRYGLAASGTMAHSFVETYPDEAAAFRAFALHSSGPVTVLVDTYDTERGVRMAAELPEIQVAAGGLPPATVDYARQKLREDEEIRQEVISEVLIRVLWAAVQLSQRVDSVIDVVDDLTYALDDTSRSARRF